MAQPEFAHDAFTEWGHIVEMPVADATAIAVGDLLSYESNLCIVMDGATDDATFVGMSLTKKVASDGQVKIRVHIAPVVWIDVTSASYIIGAELKWASSNTLVASGASNAIGRVVQLDKFGNTTATVSRLKAFLITDKYWRNLSA